MIAIAAIREFGRLNGFASSVPDGHSILEYADPATGIGAVVCFVTGMFALRVALRGDAAFATMKPRRVSGKRAIHGSADWMPMTEAKRMFGEDGGIVIGEAYRVDKDSVASHTFRADEMQSWGAGGKSPLLCFDASFGSTHGLIFAGSGGFKTTSVTIPTALKWGGGLVALDPSNEVAPMVENHRRKAGRRVFVLSPKDSSVGFNVLDWIGRYGGTKEEDVLAIASWVVTDVGKQISMRDDFFRASALQLITALIADVCLSGHTKKEKQTLRQVRMNLSEPEPKLRERLQTIHDNSKSEFVRENVAAFVNMTPEPFSGVYANAIKETHWLSYPNYAALVSGSSLSTDDLANGNTDIFVNLDLKVLESHPGLARTIIGALLNAIYNRKGRSQAARCSSSMRWRGWAIYAFWKPRGMRGENTASACFSSSSRSARCVKPMAGVTRHRNGSRARPGFRSRRSTIRRRLNTFRGDAATPPSKWTSSAAHRRCRAHREHGPSNWRPGR